MNHHEPPAANDRALRQLYVLFAVAFVVSIVHYVDNTINLHDYPRSATLPNPNKALVAGAWFAFTASGLAGVRWYRQGRYTAASVAIAGYSGSGLLGFLHYVYGGTSVMPWWRHAHILADIACGLALFAFSFRTYNRGVATA